MDIQLKYQLLGIDSNLQASFTQVYYSVHPCESCVCPHGIVQLFHAFPCRKSHSSKLECSSSMDTAATPNLTGCVNVDTHPRMQTMCVWVCAPAPTCLSNWQHQLCLCSRKRSIWKHGCYRHLIVKIHNYIELHNP